MIDSKQEEVTLASCPWGGVGDRQLARGDDLGGELELFIQGGEGNRQLAGSGNLVGELEPLVQGGWVIDN